MAGHWNPQHVLPGWDAEGGNGHGGHAHAHNPARAGLHAGEDTNHVERRLYGRVTRRERSK